MVAHHDGVVGVGGSNPLAPTNLGRTSLFAHAIMWRTWLYISEDSFYLTDCHRRVVSPSPAYSLMTTLSHQPSQAHSATNLFYACSCRLLPAIAI